MAGQDVWQTAIRHGAARESLRWPLKRIAVANFPEPRGLEKNLAAAQKGTPKPHDSRSVPVGSCMLEITDLRRVMNIDLE
eukprot:1142533-Pyramimonas_sp.AAC.1